METPLKITYRNVKKTKELDGLINEKCAKLEEACDHIISCNVTVEKPQEHLKNGSAYRVRINLRVPPGHEVVVKREPGEGDMHEPLSSVVIDVFDSAWRNLKKLSDVQSRRIKKHPAQEVNAFVQELFKDKGYGFLEGVDGRKIYFHKNSVLGNKFDRLRVGDGVRYLEEMGEKGPQARSVQVEYKPPL